MWPLTQLNKRRYERRFNAAVLIYLGAYRFKELDLADRLRIDYEVDELFKQIPETPASMRSGMVWNGIAAYRAVAMARLNIPLAGELSWPQLLKPWRRWPFPWFDNRSTRILFAFRLFDQATADARRYLNRIGLKVPEINREP